MKGKIILDNNNFVNGDGIPMGFGMALAQNEKAMEYFSSLSSEEKQSVIARTHNINSKEEMQAYVQKLTERSGGVIL